MSARGRYRLGVMLGDGIGPEIVPASVRVVDAALAAAGAEPVEWEELPLGASAIEGHGSAVPEATLTALAGLDGWLLGPHDSAAYPEPFRSRLDPSGAIRKRFGLYANIRPARGFEGEVAIAPETDQVIVRGTPRASTPTATPSRAPVSSCPRGTSRWPWGCSPGRRSSGSPSRPSSSPGAGGAGSRSCTRPTSCGSARACSGRVCLEVGRAYPDVEVDDVHIDAMTVHLLRRASSFDVVVAENVFGDILSDLAGELAGSLGIAPSINASEDRCMAQAAHGSAPDIAGRGRPTPSR